MLSMDGHIFISFDVTTEAVIVFLSKIIIGALLPEARPVSDCQTDILMCGKEIHFLQIEILLKAEDKLPS